MGKDTAEHPIVGKLLAVNVHFANIGKSAAVNVVPHKHILFGSNAGQLRSEPIDEPGQGSVIDQGDSLFATAISTKDTYKDESVEYEPDELLTWDGSYPILVFGRVTYEDSLGNQYCVPYVDKYLPTSNRFAVASGSNVARLCPEKYRGRGAD